MASAKKNQADSKVAEFDYSAFVPEGASVKDLVTVEHSLTPIYQAEEAWDEGWPPACGWTDRFVILPEQKTGSGANARTFIPRLMQIYAEFPTKAMKGTGDDKVVTDIAGAKGGGDPVLVPLNAQQLRNIELLMAIGDPEKSYYVVARVRGKIDVGQPQDMWDWHIQLIKDGPCKPRVREGKYAIPVGGTQLDLILSATEKKTATGEIYDGRTGEVISKNTAAAPAS